jgi:kynureninase
VIRLRFARSTKCSLLRAYEITMTDHNHEPFFEYREQFALPPDVIYLDGNSLGALPKAAIERVQAAVVNEWGNGLIRSWNTADWINAPVRCGNKFAKLIGADEGEVIATDITSTNLFKALLSALALQEKHDASRNVIVSDIDNFPTDLYIAQGLRELLPHRNIELRFVNRSDIENAIDARTAVVMLTEVDYRTGERYDMQKITALAQSKGALMLWDLAHSTCAFGVGLNACNADFAVGCGYKYVNGGPGAPAFLFAAKRHLDALDAMKIFAPISGWFAHAAPFAFEPNFRVARGISRFQVGTPSILQFAALEAALDMWLTVDMNAVRVRSNELCDAFIEAVETRCGDELTLATPRNANQRGSQVSFRHSEGYAVMQALIARGVIGDFRAPDILRFGFTPLYVTMQNVIDAAEHVRDILATREWDQPQFKTKYAVT